MEKIINYKVEEKIANSVRKILANISDVDMQKNYGLTNEEVLNIHIYLDNVDIPEDEG